MTEQNQETPHKIKDFDAVVHDAFIRECAHEIVQANLASQEVVNKHLSGVRKKLAQAKQIKKHYFSASYLRNLANKRRLLKAQQVNCEAA